MGDLLQDLDVNEPSAADSPSTSSEVLSLAPVQGSGEAIEPTPGVLEADSGAAMVTTEVAETPDIGASIPAADDSPLRAYQREHAEKLLQKSRKSSQLHEEQRARAQKEIQQALAEYEEQCAANHKKNRQEEQSQVEATEALLSGKDANIWGAVCELVDLKAKSKGRDTSRMRSILLDLKHNSSNQA